MPSLETTWSKKWMLSLKDAHFSGEISRIALWIRWKKARELARCWKKGSAKENHVQVHKKSFVCRAWNNKFLKPQKYARTVTNYHRLTFPLQTVQKVWWKQSVDEIVQQFPFAEMYCTSRDWRRKGFHPEGMVGRHFAEVIQVCEGHLPKISSVSRKDWRKVLHNCRNFVSLIWKHDFTRSDSN